MSTIIQTYTIIYPIITLNNILPYVVCSEFFMIAMLGFYLNGYLFSVMLNKLLNNDVDLTVLIEKRKKIFMIFF